MSATIPELEKLENLAREFAATVAQLKTKYPVEERKVRYVDGVGFWTFFGDHGWKSTSAEMSKAPRAEVDKANANILPLFQFEVKDGKNYRRATALEIEASRSIWQGVLENLRQSVAGMPVGTLVYSNGELSIYRRSEYLAEALCDVS